MGCDHGILIEVFLIVLGSNDYVFFVSQVAMHLADGRSQWATVEGHLQLSYDGPKGTFRTQEAVFEKQVEVRGVDGVERELRECDMGIAWLNVICLQGSADCLDQLDSAKSPFKCGGNGWAAEAWGHFGDLRQSLSESCPIWHYAAAPNAGIHREARPYERDTPTGFYVINERLRHGHSGISADVALVAPIRLTLSDGLEHAFQTEA
jgi:hypothetical protein